MSEPFLGEIKIVPFNFAPRGWADCNGQLLQISQNSALFSLIGTIYGGNGETTFGIPDLRGRFPTHLGQGSGLSPRQLGARSGAETVTLNSTQIPPHSHTLGNGNLPTSEGVGSQTTPNGAIPAQANDGESNYSQDKPDGSMALGGTTDNAGGGQAHDNMPPFLVVRFTIALQGVFPSQN